MWFEDAPLGISAIREHIAVKVNTKSKIEYKQEFKELDEIQQTEIRETIYDGFFRDLSILDSKANGLASANAIIAGLIAVIIQQNHTAGYPYLLTIGFLAAVASLILILSVFYVRWSTTEELGRRTLEGMVENICRTRSLRTIRFRLAQYLLVFSLLIISLYIGDDRLLPGLVR